MHPTHILLVKRYIGPQTRIMKLLNACSCLLSLGIHNNIQHILSEQWLPEGGQPYESPSDIKSSHRALWKKHTSQYQLQQRNRNNQPLQSQPHLQFLYYEVFAHHHRLRGYCCHGRSYQGMCSVEKIANRNLWQLENTSVLTTVYYYFLLLLLPVQERAGCVATSYDQIAGTKGCSAITIQGPFTVPANKKIDLTGLKTGTTIKISMTIRDYFIQSLFSPKKTPDSNLAFKINR